MNTKNQKKGMKKVPQKKNFDTNKVLAYILAGLIVFWTVASVFGFIAYGRTKKEKSSNLITASALTATYEDLGAGEIIIDLPCLYGFTVHAENSGVWVFRTRFSLVFGDGYAYYIVHYQGADNVIREFSNENYLYPFVPSETNVANAFAGQFIHLSGDLTVNFNLKWDSIFYRLLPSINSDTDVFSFVIYVDFGLNGVTTTCQFVLTFTPNVGVLDFTNTNDNYIYLPFEDEFYRPNTFVAFIHEAYGFPIADSIYWYDLGRKYDSAYSNGYTEGYRQGEDYGYDLGYDTGYNKGVASANEYSFDGLLSAVFDVPVRTFTSLFNFEVLGVNLTTFFLSLLTLAGVLAVVRMLL